jgi:uncharacterized DUF497 family protein
MTVALSGLRDHPRQRTVRRGRARRWRNQLIVQPNHEGVLHARSPGAMLPVSRSVPDKHCRIHGGSRQRRCAGDSDRLARPFPHCSLMVSARTSAVRGRRVDTCICSSYTLHVGLLDQFFESLEGFQWDEGNAAKSRVRHEVSQAECEQLFLNRPIVATIDQGHSKVEQRFAALGHADSGRQCRIYYP